MGPCSFDANEASVKLPAQHLADLAPAHLILHHQISITDAISTKHHDLTAFPISAPLRTTQTSRLAQSAYIRQNGCHQATHQARQGHP
jgi:hypothetical protein